jgi:hypothetical protein
MVILIALYVVASALEQSITGRFLGDVDAYWGAAMRLRHAEPLYADLGITSSRVYRYAPWFAYAWVPLTYLPRTLVQAGWLILLIAASIAAIQPLVATRSLPGVLLAILLGSTLAFACHKGNVQPLVVAGLVHGLRRRTGPFMIGIAASLKATPLILALVYAGRRQWGRFGLALAATALLTGPMLLFDLSGYPVDPGPVAGPLRELGTLPWLIAVVGLAALVVARARWIIGATGVMLALPRLLPYDPSYFLIAANDLPVAASDATGRRELPTPKPSRARSMPPQQSQ